VIDLLERGTVATATAWVGRIEYDADLSADDAQKLASIPAAAVTDGRLTLVLHTEAATCKQAADDILRNARDTIQAAGLRMQPAGLHIQTRDDFDRGIIRPPLPTLIGYAEIAKMLSVSRQRARALAERADFPAVASQTNAGPLYARDQVEAFIRGWNRRPGRAPGVE
jgi:hypothetical protein